MDHRRLASIVSSVLLGAACSASAPNGAAPEGATPASADDAGVDPPTEGTSSDAGTRDARAVDASPAPPRPEPADGGHVRDCGNAFTQSTPLRTSYTWLTADPIRLGAGIGANGILSDAWVAGTPRQFTSGISGSSASGPDEGGDSLADALFDGAGFPTNLHGPQDAVMTWARSIAPTATRINYVEATTSLQDGWTFANEHRTANAPAADSARFVRTIVPKSIGGFAFSVEVDTACSLAALADSMGRMPLVKSALTQAGLFDPTRRSAIQDTLVREGARLRLDVLATGERTSVESAVAASSCSTHDLGACEALVEALHTSAVAASSGGALADYEVGDASSGWIAAFYESAPISIVP